MIYIVSGFMRSGTSMMMSCLEAGGLQVVKSPDRDRLNDNHSDEFYRPNPVSLYEPDQREIGKWDWPRKHDGCVLKVVCPWIRQLAVHDYRVIWMDRDSEEIRQSYEGAFGGKLTIENIETAQKEGLSHFTNRKDVKQIIRVPYAEMIADPDKWLFRIETTIGRLLDRASAAAVVNQDLYRFRLERLTPGI